MEKRTRMPKSTRKFIRTQKARIRRQFFDIKKQEAEITELYKRVNGEPQIEAVKEVVVKKVAVKETPKQKTKKVKVKK